MAIMGGASIYSSSVQDINTGNNQAVNTSEEKYKVFLAWTSEECAEIRQQLAVMLEKVNYTVLPVGQPPENEAEFKLAVERSIEASDFSIHILGSQLGKTLTDEPNTSITKYQFDRVAVKARKGGYKRLVWQTATDKTPEEAQALLINSIQNNLQPDMMFTAVSNPAQFIDDIRTYVHKDTVKKVISKDYDLAFIANQQDAGDCYLLIEKLSEDLKVNTLTVTSESDADYRKLALEAIQRSRMAVIFFKEASDWAVAFTKQIWKTVGGASAKIPFLVIGEDEPRRNRFLSLRAPNVAFVVVPQAQIYNSVRSTYTRYLNTGTVILERFAPYTGLRPFNEDESIFFRGREKHIDYIIDMMEKQKFVMVTGTSGDGKSSLLFAGVIPSLKSGFLKTRYTRWAVASFRPERTPLRNMAAAVAGELKLRDVDAVETQLGYGFSALIDLYKKSSLYIDPTSEKWINATEDRRKEIRKQSANLLILVDQFEEFFTNSENYRDGVASPVAQIAVNVLIETIRIAREENLPVYVVFTMRSDYIGQCVAFRGFAELIGLSTYFVPRLKREEVQEVIQSPAILNGDRISVRLTHRILNDLGEGLDQLPVLQHAMFQIWQYADNGNKEMDMLQYAQVGGLAPIKLPETDIEPFNQWFNTLPQNKRELYARPKLRNVLNRHANELYEVVHEYYTQHHPEKPLSKEDVQYILKVALTCLTKIDDNRAVRNRMSLQQITEIIGRPDIDYITVGRIINIFREPGNNFIQPFIEPHKPETRELPPNQILDITHESLIRNWEKLIEWAETENKSVLIYKDFKVQVNRWLDNDRAAKFLLSSGAYDYFNGWFETQKPSAAWIKMNTAPEELIPDLDPSEQAALYLEDIIEFLRLSKAKIDRNRRLVLIVIGVISVLFLLSLITAYFATLAKQEAEYQKAIAEEHARNAERQRIIAENHAREAQNQRLIAEREMLRAEQQFIIAENQRRIAEGERLNAELQRQFAENQRRIAEYNAKIAENQRKIAEEQTLIAENQTKLAEQRRLEALAAAEEALIQKELAIQQRNNALILQSLFLASLATEQVDAANPQVALNLALEGLPNIIGGKDERPYVAETEAALYYAANAIVNDKPQAVMTGHKNKIIFNRFSPDGKKIITTSWDKTAKVWDANSGALLKTLPGHVHIVDRAYFSEDGDKIVTMADDFTARMYSINNPNFAMVLRGHENLLTDVAMTTDGTKIVTTSLDKTARIWNARTGQLIKILGNTAGTGTAGHKDAVTRCSFSPDNSKIITVSKDGTGILWTAEGNPITTLKGHTGPLTGCNFSKDGSKIVTTSDDKTAKIWDAQTGELLHTLTGHQAGINDAGFSNNGQMVVTASKDMTAKVWDVNTGKQIGVLKGHSANVYGAVFSSDDKRISTSSDDRTARLWDASSFLRLAVFKGHPGLNYAPAFSPDSRQIVMCGPRYQVEVYKVLPDKQDLLDLVRSQLRKRELTEDEKRRFFLTDDRVRNELNTQQIREQIRKKQNENALPNKELLKPEFNNKPGAKAAPDKSADPRKGKPVNPGIKPME
jgi:Tol biopolymer transport system component/energy-coupling factor transporter ATP-binding protein EcfA2